MKINLKLKKLIDAVYGGKTVYLWRSESVIAMSNVEQSEGLIAIVPRYDNGQMEYAFAQYDEGDWNTCALDDVFLTQIECEQYGRGLAIAKLRKRRDEIDAEIAAEMAKNKTVDVLQQPLRSRSGKPLKFVQSASKSKKGKRFNFVGVTKMSSM